MIRKPLSWSVKQIVTMIDKGTITFDNPLQRPEGQWKIEDKSLLIDSLLRLFIPDILALQGKDGKTGKNIYDTIDGKQRLLDTIYSYINDQWALTELLPFKMETTGETYDISGKKFSELPEETQDAIKSFMVTFKTVELEEDDDEEEVVRELFYRWNNGKAVSREHLALVKAGINVQEFVRKMIKEHPLFANNIVKFTPNAIKKSDREMTILQTIILLSKREFTNFVALQVEKFFEVNVIEDEILERTKQAFDNIAEAFPKTHAFLVKVNIPIIAYVFDQSTDKKSTAEKLLAYIKVSEPTDSYRLNTGAGSVKKEKVNGRMQVLSSICNGMPEDNEEENKDSVEIGADFKNENEGIA